MNLSTVTVSPLSILVFWMAAFGFQTVQAQTGPNVIIIISDDAGYQDFGFMDQVTGLTSQVPTPNLDALAGSGVTFSRGYVAATCQATRAAILTGGYQQRIGNENVGSSDYLESHVATNGYTGIPDDTTTLFDRFRGLGYTTCAIGKWHVGGNEHTATQIGNRPERQGVDEFYGFYGSGRDYDVGDETDVPELLRETITQSNGSVTTTIAESSRSGEYVTESLGDYAVDFINNHYDDAAPFLLYQAFSAPHNPFQDSPEIGDSRLDPLRNDPNVSQSRLRVASNILTLDNQVGRIINQLEDPNGDGNTSDSIRGNTLIIFVNDNGGVRASRDDKPTDNGPLRSQKGSAFEGGIRVPYVIAGAGVDAAQSGSINDTLVHGVDILPTVFAAAGGDLTPDADIIDGINILPVVNGQVAAPSRTLVHRRDGAFGVVRGDFKLLQSRRSGGTLNNIALYNVTTDIGETTNLIGQAQHQNLVEELKQDLTEHEVQWDKQRYAFFGRTLVSDNINTFDHFVSTSQSGSSNWSDADNWSELGTNNLVTMQRRDSFPGAVLEFDTSDQSYTSVNDMVRMSGLEFMLNQLVLGGDFTSAANHSGTIDGNDVFFTNDLDGNGPEIAIEGSNQSGGEFSYNLDLNLIVYEDLAFTGDGDVTVNVNGRISEYSQPRNVVKRDSSTVRLLGANTYTGQTRIQGGTVSLSGDGSINFSSRIQIAENAVFDVTELNSTFRLRDGVVIGGSGSVVGNLEAAAGSLIDPGSNLSTQESIGTMEIDGDLEFEIGSTLLIQLGTPGAAGLDYDQLSVVGDLNLSGGRLVLSLLANASAYLPGTSFNVLNFNSVSGDFSSLILPTLPADRHWDTSNLLIDGSIVVNSDVLLGDVNLDGVVNFLDISAFIAVLTNAAFQAEADCDENGVVNFSDISPFITILGSQ